MKYASKLLGLEKVPIPAPDDIYCTELDDEVKGPVVPSGPRLNEYEEKEADKAAKSRSVSHDVALIEMGASFFEALPDRNCEERHHDTSAIDRSCKVSGGIRSNQTYTMAYEWARKAEQAYRFERGISDSKFLQLGYWDAGRDGLLAGEKMLLGLKQLEAAYHAERGYGFEISKVFSTRQLNPIPLLQLRDAGMCEFALAEVLFDMDYPGHYLRKIKSVSLTIPCVVGPYTSLSSTLRLLSHKYRTKSSLRAAGDYREHSEQTDARFSTVNVPIKAIAVSNGQNDTGTFDLNFKDERYLPFVGAGATSIWRLELPTHLRPFDYETITDVLLHMHYTSRDGGTSLKEAANTALKAYIKSVNQLSDTDGLFSFFDVRSDFMAEWHSSMKPTGTSQGVSASPTTRTMKLPCLYEKLPVYTRGTAPDDIRAYQVFILTEAVLDPQNITISIDSAGQPDGTTSHAYTSVVITGMTGYSSLHPIPMTTWTLTISNLTVDVGRMFILVRYALT
ncbi:MAG: hypothetical protein Q9211_002358 [Gyalolechia sp. 1 TL-2023]